MGRVSVPAIDKIRQKIRGRAYYLSSHAEEEMAEDGLERSDMENAIFRGSVRKKLYMRAFIIASALLLGAPAVAEQAQVQEVRFHGIRPTDPGGTLGLRNPERGLRTEAVFAEPDGSSFYREVAHLKGRLPASFTDQWWLLDARRYEPFGLTLVQAYCYLDPSPTVISEEKLQCLQRGFDALRKAGLKAVLRFAYEKDMDRKAGPDLSTILKHIDQLAPTIQKNKDVIYVMQAGFVGAWGEWHSSAKGIERNPAHLSVIMATVLDVLPTDRMTQVRVPKYKRWVLSEAPLNAFRIIDAKTAFTPAPAARIGFHNDGFLAGKTDGGTWTEPPRYANPGNPEFDYMTNECPFVPVDGELFWSDINGRVDGFKAAVRMRLHHYSSFSLAHSYSGQEGKPYGIDVWMRTPLRIEQVKEAKLPISDGYFEDAEGRSVERTPFEYIRDHLGYRIELQGARFPRTVSRAGTLPVEVALINRGFSVLHNPRKVCFVLISAAGEIARIQSTDADPRTWQPHTPGDREFAPITHRVKSSFGAMGGLKPGAYLIGLWLPDSAEVLKNDARYAIRVANRDVPWWTDGAGPQGVNILGTILVTP